jgi:hypothetical protein
MRASMSSFIYKLHRSICPAGRPINQADIQTELGKCIYMDLENLYTERLAVQEDKPKKTVTGGKTYTLYYTLSVYSKPAFWFGFSKIYNVRSTIYNFL